MADARSRDDLQHAVNHAESSTQDGDDRELLAGDLLGGRLADRGLDLDVAQGQVAGCLIGLVHRKLAHQLAELLGGRVRAAQDGELVLNHGVVDEYDVIFEHRVAS